MPAHFQGHGCWRWDLAERPLQGGGLSPDSYGDMGHRGHGEGGFHDVACCVWWSWEAIACTKCKSEHVRVSLCGGGSPLRRVLGDAFMSLEHTHVKRVHSLPWRSNERLRS